MTATPSSLTIYMTHASSRASSTNSGWQGDALRCTAQRLSNLRHCAGALAPAHVAAPVLQWTPSIAPSGMAFYTGDAFPQWKGNLFVGALKFQLLARLVLDGERVVHEERLLEGVGRIRDIRQGPDGRLWLLDESAGRVLRIDPQ